MTARYSRVLSWLWRFSTRYRTYSSNIRWRRWNEPNNKNPGNEQCCKPWLSQKKSVKYKHNTDYSVLHLVSGFHKRLVYVGPQIQVYRAKFLNLINPCLCTSLATIDNLSSVATLYFTVASFTLILNSVLLCCSQPLFNSLLAAKSSAVHFNLVIDLT